MRVEDLRIGNLVLIAGETRQISGIIGELIYAQHTDAHKVLNAPDAVFGIPLTEEWLQSSGFDQRNGRTTWTLIVGDPGEFETSLQVGWVGKGYVQVCRSGINARSCPVHYVHQLQNLYYALTGEELKFAQSPQTN